ncbi:MAG: hypothetical protein LBL41_03370 [Bifidobacteriaceae bacterium]|jgi:uncharacterized membrane protein YcjF (UPF0283 family)|nr:hypothetical protein [Bifidobacteriaceae bacterium]
MFKIMLGVVAILASICLALVAIGVQTIIPSFSAYFASEVLTSAVFIVFGIIVIAVGIVRMYSVRHREKLYYKRQNGQDEQRVQQGIWQESAKMSESESESAKDEQKL